MKGGLWLRSRFLLAALAKETAIIIPVALFAWEVTGPHLTQYCARNSKARSTFLLVPILPLALWYIYHYARTGYVFGNPEFFRYNVRGTLQPLRIVLAFLIRIWQALGYMSLYLLTAAAALAMYLPARTKPDAPERRPRIAIEIQLVFLAMTVIYTFAMAVIGGAVLARYMLPIVPLMVLVWISTLWRRVEMWKVVVVIVGATFAVNLFVNPPYGFSIEDNLAYRDYILLHQNAEGFLEARYPMARVLTAWPANDEITRPILGYVTRPLRVISIGGLYRRRIDVRGRVTRQLRCCPGILDKVRTRAFRARKLAGMATYQNPLLRIPSRPATPGSCPNPGGRYRLQ